MQHGEKTGPSFEQTQETFRFPPLTHSLTHSLTQDQNPLKGLPVYYGQTFFRLFLNNFFYRQARKRNTLLGEEIRPEAVRRSRRFLKTAICAVHFLSSPPAILPFLLAISDLFLSLSLSLCASVSLQILQFFFSQLKLITTSSCSKFKPAVDGY